MTEMVVEIILLIATILGAVSIVLVAAYDLKRIRTDAVIRKSMRRLTPRRQQHLTIIITNIAGVSALHECLRRIKKSQYRRYDVVAIMSRPSAAERRTALESSPIENLIIYSPQGDIDDSAVIVRAYSRSKRGEMVALLRGSDYVAPAAFKQSVVYLQQSADVDSVRFVREMPVVDSMSGLYVAFTALSASTYRKALAILGTVQRQPIGHSGIYRAQRLLKAAKHDTPIRTIDARIPGTYKSTGSLTTRKVAWRTIPLRLLFVALAVYGAAVAALLQTPLPLMLMWAIVSIWLLAVIWSSDENRMAGKLSLSICVPIGMFVIASGYIVSGVMGMITRKAF